MVIETREQLHALIDRLRDDRLAAAHEALSELDSGAEASGGRLIARLRADGSLLSEPPALSDDEHRRLHERPPVPMRGEPIAQTIVHDRRGLG